MNRKNFLPFRKLYNFLFQIILKEGWGGKSNKLLSEAIFSVVMVFLLYVVGNSLAQNQSPQDDPFQLVPPAMLGQVESSWEEKALRKPYVIILDEQKTILNQDWSFDVFQHLMIRVQKEDEKTWGEIPIHYNKNQDIIENIDARVIDQGGKIEKYTKIQDVDLYAGMSMYGDSKVKMITLPKAVSGSIIDLTVKKKIKASPIESQYWSYVVYPRFVTKTFKSTYVFPSDKEIVYKDYKRKNQPNVSRDQSMTTYSFELQETDALAKEYYSPPDYEIEGFSMFSSVKDWKIIADWYRLQMNKDAVADSQITETVQDLIKNKKTQKEKVLAIFEFLQDTFRYVPTKFGENFFYRHPVSEIFKNQYADSKDWSFLVKKMLVISGIQSNICLLTEEFEGNLQESLPNLLIFSHVILEVMVDNQKYFVDLILKGYDLGQFPLERQAAQLLVITDQDYHFDQLPILKEEENMLVSNTDVFINEDGSATYEMKSQWGLDDSVAVKEQWRALEEKDKEEFNKRLDALTTRGAQVSKRLWDDLDKRYGRLVSTLRFKRPESYLLLNESMVLTENPRIRPLVFSQKTRINPIFSPQNSIVKSTIVYHIPQGFSVDFVPEGYDFKTEGFENVKSFENLGSVVQMTDIYRTKRSLLGVERYQELTEIWDKIIEKNTQYIILKKEVK